MSSGVFRGKESSNRIKLSRLVQDLLNFGVSGSLRLWGWGGWVDGGGWGAGWMGVVGGGWGMGVVGGCPPHTCTCTCMHPCTHTYIYMLNMIISIANGSPHWGNPWEFHMMSYAHVHACACLHVHVCACVWGAPSHHPPPPSTQPPPPSGGTPRISQNSIALELMKIFLFCLKI